MASISACHADDRGSIPRLGVFLEKAPNSPASQARTFGLRAYGAMAARLTPDQKVGRSTRSGLIFGLIKYFWVGGFGVRGF